MTAFGGEPFVRSEDMQDQSHREDLKHTVNNHCSGDELPLLPPRSGTSGSLACNARSHVYQLEVAPQLTRQLTSMQEDEQE